MQCNMHCRLLHLKCTCSEHDRCPQMFDTNLVDCPLWRGSGSLVPGERAGTLEMIATGGAITHQTARSWSIFRRRCTDDHALSDERSTCSPAPFEQNAAHHSQSRSWSTKTSAVARMYPSAAAHGRSSKDKASALAAVYAIKVVQRRNQLNMADILRTSVADLACAWAR